MNDGKNIIEVSLLTAPKLRLFPELYVRLCVVLESYWIFFLWFLTTRKSERRRCGIRHTEQHSPRFAARRKSLTSLIQTPHRSDLLP